MIKLNRSVAASVLAISLMTTACQEKTLLTDASTPPPESTTTATSESEAQAAPAAEVNVLQQRDDRIIVELPNRMVLVAQDIPTAPVVSVHAWVKTGSLYEQEHVGAGLSHFLEHLVSGGSTTNRPEEVSTATLGSIGAQTNAATSLDTVRYYINTTSTHTATAIDLLSDWMQNSSIEEDEYQRERDVIQREFSMGQGDPGRIHWKLTQQARFAATPDHPGAHPTIGYIDEFMDITRDELYDYYKRMYVPNNMVFVVAGDIEPQAVIDQLTTLWIDVPTGTLPELSFPIAAPGKAEPVAVEGPAAIARARVRLLWPGVKLTSEHDYALDLLSGILGGGESSRLVRDLRDNQQLVTSIDAFNYSAHWGEGFFGVDYELASPDAADAVRTAVMSHIDRIRLEPVSEEELARVKRKTLARVLNSGQSADGVASSIASNLISTADPDYLAHYAAAVQEITPADIMAAANAILDPDAASVAQLNPAGEGEEIAFPTRPPAVEDQPGVTREPIDLDNYGLVALLEANLAKPGDDAEPIAVGDTQVQTLSNGLTVLVQRSTVVPAVSMQIYTKGGLLADDAGREGVSNATYAMMRRGTTTKSAQDIAVAVEDLGASLSTGSGNNTGFVTASALTEDWPAVMELMADVTLNPSFDAEEWGKLQPRLLAAIDRATDRWSGELRSEFLKAYYPGHPWSQLSSGRHEVVESLTPDDLRAFHASRLNASESVLAVVGDVDPQEVFSQAEALFGGMPATAEEAFALPQPDAPKPGLTIVETNKPIAAVQVGFGPGITRDSADYAVIQVLSRVIGDFPAGWLQQELRGRGPGLVYASSAGASSGLVPGYFTMLFNTQADTVDDALERTLAVAERARTELVDDDTLARAKAKVLTNEFFGRQSNSSLAMGQALDLLYGVDDLTGRTFLAEVEALTAEDVRAAAQKYLGEPTVMVVCNEELDEQQLLDLID
ncbi:M16 family metallopeptidase [Algisphaera agarilytica]|uniref:Zinc protease n=1 Tax=Algisphaera agarilytica TaxID=1385975 RepID=A0A7X0LLE5_9BACT|nr:pitrilysin family protein [Algisphaera agarilytica]MBB6430829.1 zinc protease [Algisphaera agarilytica]